MQGHMLCVSELALALVTTRYGKVILGFRTFWVLCLNPLSFPLTLSLSLSLIDLAMKGKTKRSHMTPFQSDNVRPLIANQFET